MFISLSAMSRRLLRATSTSPGVLRFAARATGAVALVVVCAGAGAAHQRLLRSEPSEGARLTSSPAQLRLVFAEAVRLDALLLDLIDVDGASTSLSSPRHPGDSASIVIADVPAPLAAGAWQLRWRASGRDGHPTSGTVRFEVAVNPDGGMGTNPDTIRPPVRRPPPSAAPRATGPDLNSPLAVLVRWFNYVALVSVAGAFFLGGVIRRVEKWGVSPRFAAALDSRVKFGVLLAGVALLVASVSRIGVQVSVLRAWAGAVQVLAFVPTTWRVGAAAQVAAGLIAIASAFLPSRRRWLLGTSTCLATIGAALGGHAAAARGSALAVGLDAIHVGAAGAWLGTLVFLSLLALPRAIALPSGERGPVIALLLRGFTPLALSAAALLAATGLFAAWIHIGTMAGLLGSDYGRVLLLKVGLVGAMVALGALNWKLFGIRATEAFGELALRRSTRLEVALGVMVLLATAVLVALPTPAVPV